MSKLTRQLLIITSTCCFIFGTFSVYAKSKPVYTNDSLPSLDEVKDLRYYHPDSSIQVLQLIYDHALEKSDTITAINALLELAETNGHQANYKASYDRLWTALLLADAAKLDLLKSTIYRSLGRYYSFYKRRESGLNYLGISLNMKKRMVEEGKLENAQLVENYYAMSATYRELMEPELGQIYLDTCFLYHDPSKSSINLSFLKFEQAVLHNQNGKYEDALAIFKEILPWFPEHAPGYQVLVYHYMGDTYRLLGDFRASERCLQTALDISKKYNSHIDFTPLVHMKLSDLHYAKGDMMKAYQRLRKVKELDDKFFDSRSENNRPLLEIQDEFRNEQEERLKLVQEQRLKQLEHEDKVLLLQRTILIGSLLFLVLIGVLYFNYVRSKYQAEKQLIQRKQELEIEKANEIVELKNKELAASVLKLIEKDAFIDTLKDRLSQGTGDVKRQEIKQIVRSISNRSSENWKEFEARFVAVNKSFYEKLTNNYPKLTQGDQKLCALVKLNFSSKEMAKLLGISVESVHTTRYRLRKKLNLSREDNLTEFIANF